MTPNMDERIVDAEEPLFVRFRVSGADFRIDVSAVREIMPYRPPVKMEPRVDGVRGFVGLRGILVPLIDVRKRFSLLASGKEPARILIVSFEGRVAGIAADEVLDVEETGAAHRKGDAGVILISPSAFLTNEEKLLFDSPMPGLPGE